MEGRPRLFTALVGSLRRNSYARAIAQTLDELAPDEVAVTLAPSLGDLPLYSEDVHEVGLPEGVSALGRAITEADAVIITTPEYNFSMPGAVKNALDWLSRLPDKPLEGKPVAIQTVSQGLLGGVRAQYPLRQVLVSLNAQVLNTPEVIIPQVAGKVDPTTAFVKDEITRLHLAAQLRALGELTPWR